MEGQALPGSGSNFAVQARGEGESELLLENVQNSAIELAPLCHESFRTG